MNAAVSVGVHEMKKLQLGVAAFLVAICASNQSVRAGTIIVTSISDFNALTSGQNITGFNGVGPLDAGDNCSSLGQCFAGFPPLTVNGIIFSAGGDPVNVDSAHFYGPNDLPNAYAVNSSAKPLTITLPTPVTAFALDYGTLFDSSSATFTLSNLFTTTISPTLANFQTQFLGFISTDPFVTITFVPGGPSWVVEDVITASAATPIPAALPLFTTGLGILGFGAYRRKRKPIAT